jgi:UDP-glucose 4-epimerase
MRSLVTGVAGFIGSHLAERLLEENHDVLGVDCFTDYYAKSLKKANVKGLLKKPGFSFREENLLTANLPELLMDRDYIFHQAAQAGVRSSWGAEFEIYTSLNVLATQRLLEACKGSNVRKFIYASSSSVYGDAEELPLREESVLKPVSPYGVTKLAAEQLCYSYWKNYQIPTISLRYFTVYGPRQRPDMAFHRFMRALLEGETIEMYGDGKQTRDFTFVSDIITGNLLAMQSALVGGVYNLGGGSRVELNDVLEAIQQVAGKGTKVVYRDVQRGDVKHTLADTSKAMGELAYRPQVDLRTGLQEQWEWLQETFS